MTDATLTAEERFDMESCLSAMRMYAIQNAAGNGWDNWSCRSRIAGKLVDHIESQERELRRAKAMLVRHGLGLDEGDTAPPDRDEREDPSHPAYLDELERLLNRGEIGDALGLIQRMRAGIPPNESRIDRAYYDGARQAAAMAHQSLKAMDDWISAGCGGRYPAEPAPPSAPATCVYTYEPGDTLNYDTGCGHQFRLDSELELYEFCPYCGKPVESVAVETGGSRDA